MKIAMELPGPERGQGLCYRGLKNECTGHLAFLRRHFAPVRVGEERQSHNAIYVLLDASYHLGIGNLYCTGLQQLINVVREQTERLMNDLGKFRCGCRTLVQSGENFDPHSMSYGVAHRFLNRLATGPTATEIHSLPDPCL